MTDDPTGKQVQARAVTDLALAADHVTGSVFKDDLRRDAAALNRCVVLTAGEAEHIRSVLTMRTHLNASEMTEWLERPLALLTPTDPDDDDIGPPPPGADGEYPDPEIGMVC